MNRQFGIVKSAKIMNVFSAMLMLVCGVLLMCLPERESFTLQRLLPGLLFALMGMAKLLGYFSNDLYRLAFQYDFAIGIFCEVLAALVLFLPERADGTLPVLLTVYVILDALLKLQMTFDAKRFGMHCWLIMLITSLVLCAAGVFAAAALYESSLAPTFVIGLALAADGLDNAWITAYTVRIRAKKKHAFDRFGMDE